MPTFDEDVIVNGVVRARDGYRSLTDDWEVRRAKEHLEIREPEQAGKVWARFNDDQSLHLIGTPNLLVDGRIGVGHTSPSASLHLNRGGSATNDTLVIGNTSTKGLRLRDTGTAVDVESFGVPLFINNGGEDTLLNPQSGGNVGVGTTTPQAKLHVVGDIRATGDVVLDGADCAEEFDLAGGDVAEPGSVMSLREGAGVAVSSVPYDRRVAGVVSGAGRYRPAIVLDKNPGRENRVLVAMVGKVICRVDATTDPISVGDLLTTSDVPGHAMRASDPSRAFGAVLGKALESLRYGRGTMPVLVALQ